MTPCSRSAVDELGRVRLGTKRDETRLIRLRDDLEALGQRRAALGGHLGCALEAPLGGNLERRREAGERRPADPAGVEALGAGSRHERAVRLRARTGRNSSAGRRAARRGRRRRARPSRPGRRAISGTRPRRSRRLRPRPGSRPPTEPRRRGSAGPSPPARARARASSRSPTRRARSRSGASCR